MRHLTFWQCLAALGLGLWTASGLAVQDSVFDAVTDARARAARDVLENSYRAYSSEFQEVATYTREVMHSLIENNRHLYVIKDVDQCQFTPDIENRARLVGIAPFEYAWGDMLVTGTCVRKDEKLGLSYFEKAVAHGYAPAYMKMASFYERGYLVPRDTKKAFAYMKTAAQMGSSLARLGFADMLIRGYADEAYYVRAYTWLYHSVFVDPYQQDKKLYVQGQLEKRMPMNAVAMARASSLGM